MTSETPDLGVQRRTPPAPAKLGTHGRKLWRTLHERFDFERRELVILEQACRQRDTIADLEAVVEDLGITVKGSTGQTRLNPAVTELRLARGAFTRLLGELELPPEEEQVPGVPDPGRNARSRKAAAAANRRWSRFREERGIDSSETAHG
jgi:phage terminase small subunit